MTPRGDDRILYKNDPGQAFDWVPHDPKAEDLHKEVDLLAANGVDIYTQDVFTGQVCLYRSKHCSTPMSHNSPKAQRLMEAGVEPVQVFADRCHHNGMKFIPSMRMNDRHHRGLYEHMMSDFVRDNKRWWLREYAGGLDYSYPQVREWMLNIVEELVQRFDVDGVEFDYIRYFYLFPTNESLRKQPILTEFMGKAREILDKEGKKKGRKLLLGAWTPQTIEECHNIGLDVPTWIREGLLDYICPTDYDCPDYNAPYEDFAELTRQSDCYLYPGAQPFPARFRYFRTLMSPCSYRGLANNFYTLGADGVSAYNYMYHWCQRGGLHYVGSQDMYPHALSYLKEMREPDEIARKSRHYVFLPWRNLNLDCPGIRDRSRLYVHLTREPWIPGRGSQYYQAVFRMAEDFRDEANSLLRFKALGLVPNDQIKVVFNNVDVPVEAVHRSYYPQGRDPGWDDDSLPPSDRRDYTICEFTPSTPPEFGIEQVLGVQLTQSADSEPTYKPDGSLNLIHITEVELCVAVGQDDPDQIMSLIREKVPAPMPVVGGYHAHLSAVWREKIGLLSFGAEPSTTQVSETDPSVDQLAQSFTLSEPAQIEMIDVLLQPDLKPIKHTMFHLDSGQAAAKEPLILSVQRDTDGQPEGQNLSDASQEEFIPRDHEKELLDTFQGYYTFTFPKPIRLEAGAYWIVLGKAAAGSPYCYQALLAPKEKVPTGVLLTRQNRSGDWTRQEESLFFGVHAADPEGVSK